MTQSVGKGTLDNIPVLEPSFKTLSELNVSFQTSKEGREYHEKVFSLCSQVMANIQVGLAHILNKL